MHPGQAAPASMGGGHPLALLIAQQHRQAVGHHHCAGDARLLRPAGVGLQPIGCVLVQGQNVNPMDLLHEHRACAHALRQQLRVRAGDARRLQRLPLPRLVHGAVGGGYPVPRNLNYWWNFGSLAGIVLVIMIVTGVVLPPDFTTFWTQAKQQGYEPTVATIGKALLFPSSVEALGDIATNLSTEVWWTPQHPYSSSITGQSAADLAADFTAKVNRPWTQPIGFIHSLFEVAANVMGRASDVTDREAVAAAVAATDMATCVGKLAWNGAGVPPFAAQNVCKTPLVGGQWRRKEDGTFDLLVVDNKTAPEIPTGGVLEALS